MGFSRSDEDKYGLTTLRLLYERFVKVAGSPRRVKQKDQRAKTKFLFYKPTRKDDGITFRGEDMEVLKIVCSPFFFSTHRHPRRRNYAGEKKSQQTRTFPIDTAYDVKKLRDFPPGLWRYSLQWTDETCTGVKLIRETKDPGCFRYRFVDETVEPVYFDKSENCTHFGEQWQDDEDDDDGDEQDE